MNPAWVTAIVTLVTITCTIITILLRFGLRLYGKTMDFLADWKGHDASPGHKRVPGAIERLASLEDAVVEAKASVVENTSRLDAQDAMLRDIKHEVTMNSGGSLKDTVIRILAEIHNGNP